MLVQDKRVQSVTPSVIGKYTRELERLRVYCEARGVLTVHGVTRELLTGFCATWETLTRVAPRGQRRVNGSEVSSAIALRRNG